MVGLGPLQRPVRSECRAIGMHVQAVGYSTAVTSLSALSELHMNVLCYSYVTPATLAATEGTVPLAPSAVDTSSHHGLLGSELIFIPS